MGQSTSFCNYSRAATSNCFGKLVVCFLWCLLLPTKCCELWYVSEVALPQHLLLNISIRCMTDSTQITCMIPTLYPLSRLILVMFWNLSTGTCLSFRPSTLGLLNGLAVKYHMYWMCAKASSVSLLLPSTTLHICTAILKRRARCQSFSTRTVFSSESAPTVKAYLGPMCRARLATATAHYIIWKAVSSHAVVYIDIESIMILNQSMNAFKRYQDED